MRQLAISRGLRVLLDESRRAADTPLQKLETMQEIYLRRASAFYGPGELHQIRYYLKAVSYKFHLANLSLEQLWSLSHSQRQEVVSALENSLDRLEVDDDDLLLISFVFEGFLLQARTFLDFYMLYLCLLLKTGHRGSMSTTRFFKALERVQQAPFAEKAEWVHTYFRSKVFGSSDWEGLNPNNWGMLLISLRDKIAHRDRLRPSFDSDETLIGKVLFDWPTLQSTTYDRFCQYMENGMFALFTDVSPVLYELEWKSGPFHPDLWT
jgi:hypothetical protein